ncbi:MAG: hypothetical protein WD468_12720 [Pirellulales bacterium]
MEDRLDLSAAPDRSRGEPDLRAQLARILGSPWFSTADQLSAFLRFIVEEHLAGRDGPL